MSGLGCVRVQMWAARQLRSACLRVPHCPVSVELRSMKPMLIRALLTSALALTAPSTFAQDAPQTLRGATTGPTTAPGFSHAEQYITVQDVKPADNMYPVVQLPAQDKEAREKLAALQAKTGKKPNILLFLM